MQDEQLLANYNLNEQSTIDLDIALFGGKVHGSLARAGKVKGQTPKVSLENYFYCLKYILLYSMILFPVSLSKKVAKQEGKKKPKTGRAKRRIQYNRRFVNVVAGPGGRRKGPNSNAGAQS